MLRDTMHHQYLFVFDLETIPDTDAVLNLTGFDDPDTEAQRTELKRYHMEITSGKNPFPRQPFHKVVAISFLEAEINYTKDGESYHLRELRTGGEAGFDEKQLLQGFFNYFEQLKPRLVSYNGRGFDLPVLKYRAMAHGIQAPWFYGAGDKWNSYQSRYSADWHCDLLEVLSDFGASARSKLNEICSIMGFPGKFGVDGSQITTLYDNNQIDEIRNYCETDVLNTYLVYLRHMLHRGTLCKDNYNHAIGDIIALIEAEGVSRPHLREFMDAWGKASNNNFML